MDTKTNSTEKPNMKAGIIYETETDSQTENRLVVAKGEGAWGRDGLGVWG